MISGKMWGPISVNNTKNVDQESLNVLTWLITLTKIDVN